MAQNDDVKTGDELIIHSKKLGYLKAWAAQDKKQYEGLAYLEVTVNSSVLPGISTMTINTNDFDIWKADNIEGLQKVAKAYLTPHVSR